MERTEWMSEIRARGTLYGLDTRSGDVTVVDEYPDRFAVVENLSRPHRPHVVELWMDWDSISFDWPVYGEINTGRHAQDF